jgi:sugar phosphate isomerase/epimerase
VAGELGFDVVELSMREAGDVQPDELAALLDEHGLGLSAIATGQACLFDSLCLADPDPAVRDAVVARLQAEIDLAGRLGADVIVGGIRGRLEGTGRERAAQRAGAVEAIREAARYAGDRGVTILIEPINRYETNFVNTAAEGLALIDDVGEPSLRLLFDTFHGNIEETTLEGAARLAGDRLGYLHVADSNRCAPGQGHVDFCSVFDVLAEIGYEGPAVSEIVPLPDDVTAARRTASFWLSRRSGNA